MGIELVRGRRAAGVGSGRVGSGRVGSGRVGSGRVGSGGPHSGGPRSGGAELAGVRLGDLALGLGAAIFVSVAAGLGGTTATPTSSAPSSALGPSGRPGLLDFALLAVASLALVLARRCPRLALVVCAAGVLAYLLRTGPDVLVVVPVLIAVYAATVAGHRMLAIAVSAPFVVLAFVDRPVREGILPIGWFFAAIVAGEVARTRKAYVETVEQRAADAERTRDETARRRAADERLRIARELHDSLTHTISVIKVQVGVAVHLARKRGEPVPAALLAVQEASGEAMRELRATLEVLRDADDEPLAVGLDRLPELVARIASAGVRVEVERIGSVRDVGLPVEVDRAAYRIVQEALTNVARHAGAGAATVRLEQALDTLTVRIENDGNPNPARVSDPPGSSPTDPSSPDPSPTGPNPAVPRPTGPSGTPASGVGLLGMRERVAALGGRLAVGPRPGGGFSVRADLPLDPNGGRP